MLEARGIMSMKNSNFTIRNQARDLRACRAVPQPTARPCAPFKLVLHDYISVAKDTYAILHMLMLVFIVMLFM